MLKKGDNIAHIIALLRKKSNDFIMARLAEENITELAPSHGAILVVLYEEGPQSMMVLGEKINRDKSTVTVLVRKLENLGYVRREADPSDNRVSVIHLTEKGFKFRGLFQHVSKELREKIWGDVSEKDKEELCDQLIRMVNRL